MERKIENKQLCKECGGRCCKRMGCHYSPDDFEEITYESLKKEIEKGFISIDWWEGNPFEENKDDDIGRAYYLRIRNKDGEIVDPSWGGECILLTDDGCLLSYEERPKGARMLEPDEYGCISYYNKQQAARDWYKYNDILSKLAEEFGYNEEDEELDLSTALKNALDTFIGR